MASEKEILMFQKAAMFDLLKLLKADPDKTYTYEELEKLIWAYIEGKEK